MSDKFNPTEHLTNIKGKQYLEVKWRLVWFKQDYLDRGWSIRTTAKEINANAALFLAEAADDKGAIRATGYGYVTDQMFPRFVEKAETAAIGRCLAILGLGTQFAQELDEDTEGGELADAPVAKKMDAYVAARSAANPQRAVAAKVIAAQKPTGDIDLSSIPF